VNSGPERDRRRSRRLAWAAWVVVCVVWGTTYVGIKVSLETLPPFVMSGTRHVLAGLVTAGVLAARGRALPPRAAWGPLAVLGFFMILLGNGGVVWGEQFVPSGLTAVLLGTSAFWMIAVNAMLPDAEGMRARQWLGLAVGLAGIGLLVWPDIVQGGARGRGFAIGVVSLQVACAAWAIGSAYTRRHVLPGDVLGSAAVQMLLGGVMMLLVGGALGEWGPIVVTPRTLAAWAYLTIVGSVIGFAAFSYALQHLPIAVVSLYTYVNPIIAVWLGTLLLGEPFDARMLVAVAVIALGMLLVGSVGSSTRSRPVDAAR
jgi:drug/metabolite transporter (DMT)-like permease